MTGTIVVLDPRGFGFIDGLDGVRYFFNAKELRGTVFETLVVNTPVSFTAGTRLGKGPRAFGMRVVATEVAA